MSRRGYEPVGVHHGQPNTRDLDYRVPHTKPGDDFLAMLQDELDPTVIMYGRELRTSYDDPAV